MLVDTLCERRDFPRATQGLPERGNCQTGNGDNRNNETNESRPEGLHFSLKIILTSNEAFHLFLIALQTFLDFFNKFAKLFIGTGKPLGKACAFRFGIGQECLEFLLGRLIGQSLFECLEALLNSCRDIRPRRAFLGSRLFHWRVELHGNENLLSTSHLVKGGNRHKSFEAILLDERRNKYLLRHTCWHRVALHCCRICVLSENFSLD